MDLLENSMKEIQFEPSSTLTVQELEDKIKQIDKNRTVLFKYRGQYFDISSITVTPNGEAQIRLCNHVDTSNSTVSSTLLDDTIIEKLQWNITKEESDFISRMQNSPKGNLKPLIIYCLYYNKIIREMTGYSPFAKNRIFPHPQLRYLTCGALRNRGYSLNEIGLALSLDHSSVSASLKKLQDMIDYPKQYMFNATMSFKDIYDEIKDEILPIQ